MPAKFIRYTRRQRHRKIFDKGIHIYTISSSLLMHFFDNLTILLPKICLITILRINYEKFYDLII